MRLIRARGVYRCMDGIGGEGRLFAVNARGERVASVIIGQTGYSALGVGLG